MLPRFTEEAIRPMFVPQFQPGLCEPANRSGTRGVGYGPARVAIDSQRDFGTLTAFETSELNSNDQRLSATKMVAPIFATSTYTAAAPMSLCLRGLQFQNLDPPPPIAAVAGDANDQLIGL